MKFSPQSNNTGVFVIACVLLIGLIYVLSKNKNRSMMSELASPEASYDASVPVGSSSEMQYASANGIQTTVPKNLPSQPPMPDPSGLLPNDTNSQWASLNPAGNGALQSVNLLQAGSLIGINTQGSSLRNANLQLRSEPPISKQNIGPWMNSTIEPDSLRKPLEIGGSL